MNIHEFLPEKDKYLGTKERGEIIKERVRERGFVFVIKKTVNRRINASEERKSAGKNHMRIIVE